MAHLSVPEYKTGFTNNNPVNFTVGANTGSDYSNFGVNPTVGDTFDYALFSGTEFEYGRGTFITTTLVERNNTFFSSRGGSYIVAETGVVKGFSATSPYSPVDLSRLQANVEGDGKYLLGLGALGIHAPTDTNTHTGDYTFAAGKDNVLVGDYSSASGIGATTHNRGDRSHSNGSGQCWETTTTLYAVDSGTGSQILYLDGTTGEYQIPNDCAATLDIMITGHNTNKVSSARRTVAIEQVSSGTLNIHSTQTIGTDFSNFGTPPTPTISAVSGNLRIALATTTAAAHFTATIRASIVRYA